MMVSAPDSNDPSEASAEGDLGTATGVTTNTQELTDLHVDSITEEPQLVPGCWGKLLHYPPSCVTPCNPKPDVLLTKKSYNIGKDKDSDIVLDGDIFGAHFPYVSHRHFRVFKEQRSNGTFFFVQNCSSNRTYVTGVEVKRGTIAQLKNYDEIAIVLKKFKVFIFVDTTSAASASPLSTQAGLPPQVSSQYSVTRKLGSGSFGVVSLAWTRGADGSFKDSYAIKSVLKKEDAVVPNMQPWESVREAMILKTLDHPAIIKIHDVIDTELRLFFVLEYIHGGVLHDHLGKCVGTMKEEDVKLIFCQISRAVQYLHEKRIVHRDLKPENILLTDPESVHCLIKVTDFGLSKFLSPDTFLKTFCGTPMYLAPEMILTRGVGNGPPIDIWSMGVMLYFCLSGEKPFSPRLEISLKDQIVGGKFSFSVSLWKAVSAEALDLTTKLMTMDPSRRFTASECLSHAWFQDDSVVKHANFLMGYSETLSSCHSVVMDSASQSPSTVDQSAPTCFDSLPYPAQVVGHPDERSLTTRYSPEPNVVVTAQHQDLSMREERTNTSSTASAMDVGSGGQTSSSGAVCRWATRHPAEPAQKRPRL